MYNYEEQKSEIFTEEGQTTFLAVRDNVSKLLDISGAVTMGDAISNCGGGSSWFLLACVDRLVELGEIFEIKQTGVTAQSRVFRSTKR